ncbi:response regulator [Pseudorhodoferax sp.]|uniref:response regulator n=1 Tax=Pseudorhodoferax sp. TaxID=1993553 RepID=UPI0039E5C8B9
MPLRIFLVEDNPLIRQAMAETIGDLVGGGEFVGWGADQAESIRALLDLGDGWDVAIVDLFLKTGSGLGVARALQARAAHQHVFVVTNYATDDMRERCAQLRVDAVYDKSTQLEHLIEALVRLGSPLPPTP